MAFSPYYMTTEEVAAKTKVSQRQILNLIASGWLPSKKVGRLHLVRPADIVRVKDRPKMGRPKKVKTPEAPIAPAPKVTTKKKTTKKKKKS